MASTPIGVRFPETEYDEIVQRAERAGVTPSDIVRNGYRASVDDEYLLRVLAQRMSMMEVSILKKVRDEFKNLQIKIEE